MSTHTPGPWHVANGCQIRGAKDQIAKAWMMRNGEGLANARLIAAAPELLAALEMVMRRGRIDDNEEAMNQVAAAITKAKRTRAMCDNIREAFEKFAATHHELKWHDTDDWDTDAGYGSVILQLAYEVWQAALAAAPAAPAGWKLVPIEPTPEMLAATSWSGCAGADYAKMIAAAPDIPQELL